MEVEGGDGVEEGAAGNEEGLDYHRSVSLHISIGSVMVAWMWDIGSQSYTVKSFPS